MELHRKEPTERAEPPIMLRADVNREEIQALRVIALMENKTTQALLAELIRERIARATS